MTDLPTPFARNLGVLVAWSPAGLALPDQVHGRRKTRAAGRDIVHEGQVGRSAHILAAGWG